ncbi:UNVERIFIED_ORG: hypothetical protein FHR35_000346 [Microbispora rosea subsp. rosea]
MTHALPDRPTAVVVSDMTGQRRVPDEMVTGEPVGGA